MNIMKKQIIISIGREYGSGGHEIAQKLAEKLNIDLYDRNLLDEISKIKSSTYEDLVRYDEKPKSFFSHTVRGYSNSQEVNVAELQFALLKSKAADEDSFVVVGRCTDKIFDGIAPVVSVFICADIKDRIARIENIRHMSEKDAIKKIEKHDKRRASYHDYFCKTKWGNASSYDVCLNSSLLGIDGTVEVLYNIVQKYIND